VKKLKALAGRVDREESASIKAQGRAIFKQHERLLNILDALVAERKRQRLSLNALAERTGIAKPNLSRLENRGTPPTLETLERYARAVGETIRVELADVA
jgi:DNA-binding Xre family transcriptional regulator